MLTTPAFLTARCIARASATVNASGFSHITALPARAAAIAMAAWESFGVVMSTMSMRGSLTTSRQSVAKVSQPNVSAISDTPALLRPQMVFMTGRALSLKNLGAFIQAFEWARPMNLYPIMPTFSVRAIFLVSS